MSKLIKKFLFSLFGNKVMQNILEKVAFSCEYFMGIGSGSSVDASGEKVVFSLIESKKPIVFDVGANKGQFAQEALKNINAEGVIYSFEPSKNTFMMMKQNIHDDRHQAFNMGFGKEKGNLKLYYDEMGSGLASLTKRDLALLNIDLNKSEDVEIDTVDNFCEKYEIEMIDLLKIDVEGHELDVLYGSKIMFDKIKIVMFEFGGCNIDTKTYFRDFYKFFKENNMEIYRITPSGYLHKLNSYKESYEQFRTTNFIAKRNNV